MSALPIAVEAEPDTGVLRRKTEFGKLSVGGVVIGNAAEVRADAGTGILVAPHGRCVHEADGHETGAAEPEEGRRLAFRDRLAWIRGRASGGSLRRNYGRGHCRYRGGRNKRCRA